MVVRLYADGAAIRNPGPGGYAAILVWGNERKELSGSYRWTTNNRMEILSCIEGLRILEVPCKVTVVSDYQYVVNGINQWIALWKRKNWISKKSKKPVLNQDLWLELDELMLIHDVHAVWVKAHTHSQSPDAIENRRCDTLAEGEAASCPTAIHRPYEMLNPPRPKVPSRRLIQKLQPMETQLSLSDHEKLIQSELIWIHSHLESD
ncbi:MAG TPA: ribonuclease HI [Chthoniobacterales bacterium]|jgi:ribonuclease HI|nr:ribonuclease HI [Chthoniobacterales bacterium]